MCELTIITHLYLNMAAHSCILAYIFIFVITGWNCSARISSRGQIFSQTTTSLQTHNILIPSLEGAFLWNFWSKQSSLQIRYENVMRLWWHCSEVFQGNLHLLSKCYTHIQHIICMFNTLWAQSTCHELRCPSVNFIQILQELVPFHQFPSNLVLPL